MLAKTLRPGRYYQMPSSNSYLFCIENTSVKSVGSNSQRIKYSIFYNNTPPWSCVKEWWSNPDHETDYIEIVDIQKMNIPICPEDKSMSFVSCNITININKCVIPENKTREYCFKCGLKNKEIELFRSVTFYCPNCE